VLGRAVIPRGVADSKQQIRELKRALLLIEADEALMDFRALLIVCTDGVPIETV
jgi:hypothetical protein